MKYLNIIAIALLIIFEYICSEKVLKAVYESFRHGARGPFIRGKNPFDYDWKGNMELTNVGKRQHYLLGRKLRERYKNFITGPFKYSDLYLYSTHFNRTIESALSHIQGFYYQSTEFGEEIKVNEKIALPPVILSDSVKQKISNLKKEALPFHGTIVPNNVLRFDFNFLPLENSCKGNINYAAINNKEYGLGMLKWFMDKYEKDLKDSFGFINNNDIDTLNRILDFIDNFIASWFNANDLSKLKTADIETFKKDALKIHGQQYTEYYYGANNSYIARINMSKFYRELLSYYDKRIELDGMEIGYNMTYPKMKMFSAHDSTVGPQIVFLGKLFKIDIQNYEVPYASSILYELLYDSETKNWNVEIFYQMNAFMTIDYKEFKEKVQSILIDDSEIDTFCEFKKEEFKFIDISALKTSSIVLAITAIVLVLVLGGIIFFGKKTCSIFNSKKKEIHENQENML